MVRKDLKTPFAEQARFFLFKTFKIIEIGRENNSGGDVEVYRRGGGGGPPDPDISLQRIPYELRSAAHI